MPPPLDLTLVLAATRDMGIGRNGTLPWTGLKKEMAYFARVTKRLPPSSIPAVSQPPAQKVQNAVIMGRKTWESIPERFRPLPGRLNVVVSRSWGTPPTAGGKVRVEPGKDGKDGVVVAGSLEDAVDFLKRVRDEEEDAEARKELGLGGLGRVFVIGGAQIYGAALGLREARRILLTRVRSEFECDTFFPLKLGEEEEKTGVDGNGDGNKGWRRSGQAEMDAWVGEEVARGVQTEAGTEYEFEMWERVD